MRLARFALASLSGVCFGVAAPPSRWTWLVWIAWLPLLAVLRHARPAPREAFALGLVGREGEVVLRYGSTSILGLPVYDRYVSDRGRCGPGEVARTAGVPSADQKYCPVKKCVGSDIFVDQ